MKTHPVHQKPGLHAEVNGKSSSRIVRATTPRSLALLGALLLAPLLSAAPTDLKWSMDIAKELRSPAISSDGIVFVTSSEGLDGTIHGIRDQANQGVHVGTSYTLRGSNGIKLPSPVISAGNTVYFGPITGAAEAGVHAMTPGLQRSWFASTANRGGVGGGLAVGNDGVIYKVGNEFLAITPAGKIVDWPNRQFDSNSECPPTVGPDGKVYFSPLARQFVQLDPKTGATLWQWSTTHEIKSAPAFGDDGLIYLCSAKQIYALNPTNHTQTLVYDPVNKATTDFSDSAPIIGPDGTLFIGSSKQLLAINTRTATLKATFVASGVIGGPGAIAADGMVYFGTDSGVFYAVQLEGSQFVIKGQNSGWGKIRSAPAIADDGTVYMTTESGFLLAFRGTTRLADSAWPTFQQNNRRTGQARKLIVVEAPKIIIQPADQTVIEGTTVTLSATASGTAPLRFQWRKGGQAVANANETQLVFASVKMSDAGNYQLVVTNAASPAAVSREAVLTVLGRVPTILELTVSPDEVLCEGDLVRFCVTADGTASLRFQWFNDNGPIIGQTDDCFAIDSVTVGDAGNYWVQVSNDFGSATSRKVELTVYSKNSTFVRRLPESYRPDQPVVVEIDAQPGCGSAAFAVEDAPPAGWIVTAVSDNGRWDEVNSRVKWVFTDAQLRVLNYSILPPSDARGTQGFNGTGSVDGQPVTITGDSEIAGTELHPSDLEPGDWNLTQNEVTAYIAAYKRGQVWSVAPNPIPLAYAVRAAHLYLYGEQYVYDSGQTAPMCWTPTMDANGQAKTPAITKSDAGESGVTVNVTSTEAGVEVHLVVRPPNGTFSYGLELEVPADCTGSQISDGGEYDATNQRIKWVFLDGTPRTLSVNLDGPITEPAVFKGTASFDGSHESFPAGARFVGAPQYADETATVRIYAETGRQFVLEASTNLMNWTAISEPFEGTGAVHEIEDSEAGVHPNRFYRLREINTPEGAGVLSR